VAVRCGLLVPGDWLRIPGFVTRARKLISEMTDVWSGTENPNVTYLCALLPFISAHLTLLD